MYSPIHLDRPVTPVSRLSEIRMFTVVSLQTFNFKAVMNKQRMNATELLLYLWLVLSLDSICSVCFRGKWRRHQWLGNESLNKLASFWHKTNSVILSQHCMNLSRMLLLELINIKLQRTLYSVKRWSVHLIKLAAEDRWPSWTSQVFQ